ncbi:MAG: NUDIX domain-containing protein [Tagaea sp.]
MTAPRVGCGAAILDAQGRWLLARRLTAPEAGHFGLLGGKIDAGEATRAAIKREIAEEIGVEIDLLGFLCAVDQIGPDGEHWVSIVERVRIVSGVPAIREPAKLADLGWFEPGALPAPLTQAARTALAALG